ncbi:MAG: tetratricopeptide repeat protein [Rhodospirillaceae bacterium]|nr:tetratricopeptide repeat protein [Rhodospirillaceae bacterium]
MRLMKFLIPVMALAAISFVVLYAPNLLLILGDRATARGDIAAAAEYYVQALTFPTLRTADRAPVLEKAAQAQENYAIEARTDRDIFDAYKLTREVYDLHPTSVTALRLSRLLLLLGDYQNARKILAMARASDKGVNALTATILDSQIRRSMNEIQASLDVLEAVIAASGNKNLGRDFHYNIGDVLMKLAHYAEAAEQFKAALAAQPDDVAARVQLACATAVLGTPADALELLQTARKAMTGPRWQNDIESTKRYVTGTDQIIAQLKDHIERANPVRDDLCGLYLPPTFNVRYSSPLIYQLDTNISAPQP